LSTATLQACFIFLAHTISANERPESGLQTEIIECSRTGNPIEENNTNKAFYHIETDQETSFADPETFELITRIKTTGSPAVLRIENEVMGNIAYEILNRILTRYNFSKLDIGVAYVSHQTIQINEISRRAIGE